MKEKKKIEVNIYYTDLYMSKWSVDVNVDVIVKNVSIYTYSYIVI